MLFTRKISLFLCGVAILGTLSANFCQAQSPLLRSKKPAEESYMLTKNHGPWLIMATVFANENAEIAYQRAEDLVKELRANKMKAYIYKKENREETVESRPRWVYPLERDENGETVERRDEVKLTTKARYLNKTVTTEYAVMVGDFRMDSRDKAEEKRVADALKRVREMSPKSMQGNQSSHPLFREGDAQRSGKPMQFAFMTPNPMLPSENFIKTGLDETVLNANKDIKKHSLLDCPGKYSVQVAVLKGASTLNQQKILHAMTDKDAEFSTDQTLGEADEKAVKLCNSLRKKGYEAFVFRDHYASIVTIGSFDSIGETVNNEIQLDPQIEMIIKRFSATCDASKGLAGIQRVTLDGIPFDITPKIIVVPRRPLVNTGFAAYGR